MLYHGTMWASSPTLCKMRTESQGEDFQPASSVSMRILRGLLHSHEADGKSLRLQSFSECRVSLYTQMSVKLQGEDFTRPPLLKSGS